MIYFKLKEIILSNIEWFFRELAHRIGGSVRKKWKGFIGRKAQLTIKKQKIIIDFKVKGVIHTLINLKLVVDALVE